MFVRFVFIYKWLSKICPRATLVSICIQFKAVPPSTALFVLLIPFPSSRGVYSHFFFHQYLRFYCNGVTNKIFFS